ncbi:MAG TPA: hypothetical protein VJ650_08610 [Gemmatimonadaceae bacterium]|nr:hypothetical protein [Gemmatimonadaceae bacterium]
MTLSRILRPTIHLPTRDAWELRRALEVWVATGTVPAAHIVAEPEPSDEDQTLKPEVAA